MSGTDPSGLKTIITQKASSEEFIALKNRVTKLDLESDTLSLINKVGALQACQTSAQADIDGKALKTTTATQLYKIEHLEKQMSGEETSELKTNIAEKASFED